MQNEEQIMALFMKIDSSSDGEIDWVLQSFFNSSISKRVVSFVA